MALGYAEVPVPKDCWGGYILKRIPFAVSAHVGVTEEPFGEGAGTLIRFQVSYATSRVQIVMGNACPASMTNLSWQKYIVPRFTLKDAH